MERLPTEAQFSTVNGIVADDFDKDGKTDLLIAGNMFGSEPETTRADASIGLLLKGNDQGYFTPINAVESGLHLPFDIKDLAAIRIGSNDRSAILATSNNGQLRVLGW